VAEGLRTVEELARSPLAIVGLLASPAADATPRGAALLAALAARGVPVARVDERDFATAADTESPQGILAIAEIPERALPVPAPGGPLRVLLLDGVQDPGNAGTLVRTAAALGAAATVALPGTVDLWNAKVVRSAMGAHFHHAALATDWPAVLDWLAMHDVALWGADHRGRDVSVVGAPPARLALAVGNEGGGLADAVRTRCDATVAIPIAGAVESLNVAVAAGILLHALRP
jgi:TrmH family RNA methyltransferase